MAADHFVLRPFFFYLELDDDLKSCHLETLTSQLHCLISWNKTFSHFCDVLWRTSLSRLRGNNSTMKPVYPEADETFKAWSQESSVWYLENPLVKMGFKTSIWATILISGFCNPPWSSIIYQTSIQNVYIFRKSSFLSPTMLQPKHERDVWNKKRTEATKTKINSTS